MQVTEKALARLKLVCAESGIFNVRVAVVGGGCSGLSYKLDFDKSSPSPTDTVLRLEEVTVYIDAKSAIFLEKTTLAYSDGLNDAGFTWENPDAKRRCGCGASFSI